MLSNTKHTWDTTSRKLWKPQQASRKESWGFSNHFFQVMEWVLSNIDIIVIAAGEWFIVKHDFQYFNFHYCFKVLPNLQTFWNQGLGYFTECQSNANIVITGGECCLVILVITHDYWDLSIISSLNYWPCYGSIAVWYNLGILVSSLAMA